MAVINRKKGEEDKGKRVVAKTINKKQNQNTLIENPNPSKTEHGSIITFKKG